MLRRKILCPLLLLFIIPAMSFAQLRSQNTDQVNFPAALKQGYGQIGGLFNFLGLDPSKISMSHSYSLSFMSVGGHGLSQGVYLNTIRYQISAPLDVRVQWGVAHSPLPVQGAASPLRSGFFISGASLDYTPSENFHIGIQYSSYPTREAYRYPYSMGRNSMFNRIEMGNR